MVSEAYLEAERKSRLEARTTSSNQGYYDHVVAVSQSMVNAAFADMHLKHKPLQAVHKKLGPGNELHGELHPTEILIKAGSAGASMSKVFWIIHFKTGWLQCNVMGQEEGVVVDLKDWKLAVEVAFGVQSVTFLNDDTPEQTAEKETQLKNLEGRYSWKADRYDPSFLYAKLVTGVTKGFDMDYSSFGNDEQDKPIMFDGLIARHANAEIRLAQLTAFLGFWAKTLQSKGLTTMATQFKAPASPKDVRASSYPVNEMVLQTSPYLLHVPNKAEGEDDWPEGATTLKDPGSRNCICYCELISKHELETNKRPYPYSGNFATVGNGTGDLKRIDGTFALSRNLFFETFLLPNLRNFASASIISPRPAVFSSNQRFVNSSWSRDYGVHYKEVDMVQFKSNIAVGDTNFVPTEYFFAHQGAMVKSGEKPYQNTESKRYYFHVAQANTRVVVRWNPGSGDILVQGEIEYRYAETAGTMGNVRENGELDGIDSYLR
ncbi:hypothetical protein G7Y89_g14420 [Cudoniella acicularis]|uniref:Uncharacterized protein n=1 Tax=Cudoniella acicularis TaxID=354080 RepID=A0A8H4VTH8_9HELO|nr:hypothetical protein G7Y89_g14420 [Cudoniella acicularis]